MIFMKKGNGMLRDGTRSEFLISPALVFLGCDSATEIHVDQREAEGTILFFHPNYVNDALDLGSSWDDESLSFTDRQDLYLLRHFMDDTGRSTLTVDPSMARFFTQLFVQLQRELVDQPDPYWPCRSRSFFLQILTMVDQVAYQAGTMPPEYAPLHETVPLLDPTVADTELLSLLTRLAGNIRDKFTVEDLAKSFNTNRTTLQAKFRKATGMSIAQYVIRSRIKLASILLRDTSLTVQEIMERTGFEDASHFSRMFKRYAKSNPSDFRALFHVPRYIQTAQ
jgi:AraC-like DNA-binding protein